MPAAPSPLGARLYALLPGQAAPQSWGTESLFTLLVTGSLVMLLGWLLQLRAAAIAATFIGAATLVRPTTRRRRDVFLLLVGFLGYYTMLLAFVPAWSPFHQPLIPILAACGVASVWPPATHDRAPSEPEPGNDAAAVSRRQPWPTGDEDMHAWIGAR